MPIGSYSVAGPMNFVKTTNLKLITKNINLKHMISMMLNVNIKYDIKCNQNLYANNSNTSLKGVNKE